MLLQLLMLVCVCLTACDMSAVGKPIPAGFVGKEEFFDPHGFQDYTDYCKYQYLSGEPFLHSARYHQVTEDETASAAGYFENFRSRMEAENRLQEYDFDPARIGAGDYILVISKEGQPIGRNGRPYGKYEDYSIYFFDTESLTLYYIHSNL